MNPHMLEVAQEQAEICKIFGNPNRILILWVLGSHEMSVGDISEAIHSTLPNTSQHLRLMRDKGVLTCRREGHVIYYRVDDPRWLAGSAALLHALQRLPAALTTRGGDGDRRH